MINEKKSKNFKRFFAKEMPNVTFNETLEDITLINWNEDMKGKTIVYSAKENKNIKIVKFN